jgi:hypothetical protein
MNFAVEMVKNLYNYIFVSKVPKMECGIIGLCPKFVPDKKMIFFSISSIVAKYSGFKWPLN